MDSVLFLVTMKNIQEYGYMNVENALAGAIAQTTNISVLRVSQFLASFLILKQF